MHDAISKQDTIGDHEVIEALEAILADDKFVVAPQMSAFLNFVVRQTLAGEADRIKAYTVAVDALGKPATFDPQNDPSVRVLAKRLRSCMDQYYERTDGHTVLILLQRGSYKPSFARVEPGTGAANLGAQSTGSENAQRVENPSDRPAVVHMPTPTPVRGGATTLAELAGQAPAQSSKATGPAMVADETTAAAKQRSPGGAQRVLNRVPRLVFALIAVASIGWAVFHQAPNTSDRPVILAGDEVDLDNLEIRLASNRNELSLRARPDLPTLIIRQGLGADVPAMNINSALVGVLSRFDTVQVLRGDRVNASTAFWPEDYLLDLTGLVVEDTHRLTIQLTHAASGHITHTDTLDIPTGNIENLSTSNLAMIESFAAQLVQDHGPLYHDYRENGDFAPASGCLFGHDDPAGTGPTHAEVARCADRLASEAPEDFRTLILQADLRLREASMLSGDAHKDKMEEAISLSESAVNIAPFSASAHLSLMRGLHRQGQKTRALIEAERALELNPYDGKVLRTAATIMAASDRQARADELFERAAEIDPLGAAIAMSSLADYDRVEPL